MPWEFTLLWCLEPSQCSCTGAARLLFLLNWFATSLHSFLYLPSALDVSLVPDVPSLARHHESLRRRKQAALDPAKERSRRGTNFLGDLSRAQALQHANRVHLIMSLSRENVS